MNAFIVLLEEMLVLYCILIFGWLAQRFKLLPPMSKLVFTRLLLYVTLPCLIVSSMHLSFEYERVYAVITLIVMSFLFLSITLLYGRWLSKALQLPDYRSGVFKNLLLFGNQGFIGVAVVFQLFGHEGMFLAAVFNLVYFILIWTYGIAVMNAPTPPVWKNPGLIATVIGLVFFFLPISLPVALLASIDAIGQMTIPLSMIVIGVILSDQRWRSLASLLKDRLLWFAVSHRLLILPLLIFLPLVLLDIPFQWLAVGVLLSATPCAPTISLYSELYGGDTAFASVAVVLSTLLAAFTLPLLYLIFLALM